MLILLNYRDWMPMLGFSKPYWSMLTHLYVWILAAGLTSLVDVTGSWELGVGDGSRELLGELGPDLGKPGPTGELGL